MSSCVATFTLDERRRSGVALLIGVIIFQHLIQLFIVILYPLPEWGEIEHCRRDIMPVPWVSVSAAVTASRWVVVEPESEANIAAADDRE